MRPEWIAKERQSYERINKTPDKLETNFYKTDL